MLRRVEYAHQRKIRERNTVAYRVASLADLDIRLLSCAGTAHV